MMEAERLLKPTGTDGVSGNEMTAGEGGGHQSQRRSIYSGFSFSQGNKEEEDQFLLISL